MECTKPHLHEQLLASVSLLNSKWMIEVLHHVRHGRNRFGLLKKMMPGISSKTLTERLRLLEKEELIARKVIVASAPQHIEYELTEKGRLLGTVIQALNSPSDSAAS